MSARPRPWFLRTYRRTEASLVVVVVAIAFLGFALVEGAARIQQGVPPGQRFGLESVTVPQGSYWRFKR